MAKAKLPKPSPEKQGTIIQKGRKEEVEEIIRGLVENAIDFFSTAIDEHENKAKYAILHLAVSIELFLKSRLMFEHWSLIFAQRDKVDYVKLKNGEIFQSIQLGDLLKTINKFLPSEESVEKKVIEEFQSLADERNAIVHFINHAVDGKNRNGDLELAARQCNVWHCLHQLLSVTWKDKYQSYDFEDIKIKINERRVILLLEYDKLKKRGEFTKANENGLLHYCPVCEFKSYIYSQDKRILVVGDADCKVCGHSSRVVEVFCNECNKKTLLENANGPCLNCFDTDNSCDKTFTKKELIKLLALQDRYYEKGYSEPAIRCVNCYNDNVYMFKDYEGKYFCLDCFEIHSSISQCEWCNERVAGGTQNEFSYYTGCENCGGRQEGREDRDWM